MARSTISSWTEIATEQHDQIISLLQQGELQKAGKLFAKNNLSGVDALISWLQTTNN